VSAPLQNEPTIICSSCRFPYPRVRGFCPLCGTPADEAAYHYRNSVPARPQIPLKMISAVLVLLICASLWMVRHLTASSAATVRGASIPASGQIAVPAESATQLENPAPQDNISSEPTGAGARNVEIRDDPAELWRRVQTGNADAEVQLARLYLDGRGVAQNCEQAHLLLMAASKKRSGAASNLLSGDYLRRCP